MASNIFFKKKNIRLDKLFPGNNISKKFIVKDIKPLIMLKKMN